LAVANLVKCRTEDDLVALRSVYDGEFASVMGLDPEQPRRNPFWASLVLLFEAIADKTIYFETAAVHNFRTSLKRSKRRSQSVSQRRMAEECASFGSTVEVCSCAETVHVSSSCQGDIH
jgi:hypothetical protein